jgi:hypothetical protein
MQVVDWRESAAIYRESFKRANNRDLTIKVFRRADHSLNVIGRTNGEQRVSRFVDGYFDTMIDWLRARRLAQSGAKVR